MLYVISKETFGEYDVHDIQSNSCWCECVLDGYASIPEELVEGILATQGYCDLVLNEDETEVVSFTAREIPELPEPPQTPGGTGLLTVTLDLTTETASHSSTEIMEHLSGGGSVIAKLSGDMDEYGHLWGAADGGVAFSYLWVGSTDTTQYIYTVRADKSIGLLEQTMEPGSAEDAEKRVTSVSTVRDGQTITMTMTLADNTTENHVIALDSNDYPTSITVNGIAISMEWSGFDV